MSTHKTSTTKSKKNQSKSSANRDLKSSIKDPQSSANPIPSAGMVSATPNSAIAVGPPKRGGPPPPKPGNAPVYRANPGAVYKTLKLKTADTPRVLADAGDAKITHDEIQKNIEQVTKLLAQGVSDAAHVSFLKTHRSAISLAKLPAIAQANTLTDTDRELLESLEKLIVTSEVKHGTLAKTLWSFADTVVNLSKKDDPNLRQAGLLARVMLVQVRAMFEAGAGKADEDYWNGTLSDYKEKLAKAMNELTTEAQAQEDRLRQERVETLTTALVEKSVVDRMFVPTFKDLTSDRLADKLKAESHLETLITRVAEEGGTNDWFRINHPETFVELVSAANKLVVAGKLKAETLQKLIDRVDEPLQAKLLVANADRPLNQLDPQFGQWIWDVTTKSLWTKKENGIAAQVYNALWNASNDPDKYKRIAELVKRGGTAQAFDLGRDLGRGKREGEWSGFIQPLEHLLGNYIKAVHENSTAVDKAKLEGAALILKAVAETYAQDSGKPKAYTPVLTDYDRVLKSDWLTAFTQSPGTIWGFEDVRLPYVQAGHEAALSGKPVGKRVLRMMELWDAVNLAIGPGAYSELLSDPAKSIDAFLKVAEAGIKSDEKGGKVGSLKDDSEFMTNWKAQVETYLRFLSERSPKARFDLDELRGKDMGKSMGALACKVGLHWAKKSGEKVYYILDGINMDDALDYRNYATQQINAWVDQKSPQGETVPKRHVPVITFQEIREILKNWDDLQDTVVFVRQGKIQSGAEFEQEVEGWVAKATDKGTARRYPLPSRFPERYKTELIDLVGDKGLAEILKLEAEPTTDPKLAIRLLSEARILKYALSMPEADVLASVLNDKVKTLVESGALSSVVVSSVQTLADKSLPAAEQIQAVENFRKALVNMPSESLKSALNGWLLRVNAPSKVVVTGNMLEQKPALFV